MRAIIQRVNQAEVVSDGILTGKINHGLLILLGIHPQDDHNDINWIINKIIQMRIFSDNDDKMNLSLIDVKGELLIVSQFTLFASTKKGNRPSFIQAAPPAIAIPLYNHFIDEINKKGLQAQAGVFGADMKVSLTNDGPVTILLDSKNPE
ncbi:MAG: D-aminoacyl-tRNA deacylase [Chitinophagales bacterium]|nr:D-aminoacyl-tRNA deacylase [Chitinophagales bacterium]